MPAPPKSVGGLSIWNVGKSELPADVTHTETSENDSISMKKRHSVRSMADSDLVAFTPAELRQLRSLKAPQGIQRALDKMPYHVANTAWSPRRVLAENSAHCFEGALFAAAALRANGYPPLLFDLEAERDTDHVIAIYKQ